MTHTCTKCNTISTLPQNMVWEGFACVKCKRYFTQQNGQIAYSHRFIADWDAPSILNIGDKATIDGHEWIITGYSKQETLPDGELWLEYYLINSLGEQRFLSVFNNQWALAEENNRGKNSFINNRNVKLQEGTYSWDYDEEFRTIYARGFFKDTIPRGKRVSRDFSCPPNYRMFLEIDDDGIHQYSAKSLNSKELQAMFPQLGGKLQQTNFSLQANSFDTDTTLLKINSPYESIGIILFTALFISILLLLQDSKVIVPSFALNLESNKDTSTTTKPFELLAAKQMVIIDAQCPISNNWVEVGAELTNIETGAEYYTTEEISYYSGVEDGEWWEEGSNNTSLKFCGIPKGKYVVSVNGYSPTKADLGLLVKEGGRSYGIYLGSMVILGALLYYCYSNIPKTK